MKPRLYFAFPDGAYHYVCAECTALCCRGQGFAGSLRREMGTLLALYPSLGSAAAVRHGDVLKFHSTPPACYFLDKDNLCRIEKQHGRGLKPGVCTLFPFNVFTRIGRTIAVSPHFLCPLRLVVPPRSGEVEGTHARLEAAVRESGLLDEGYLAAQASPTLHPAEGTWAVLRREKAFRDACGEGLGRRRFAEALGEASADAGALAAFVARATRLLGLEVPPEPPERDGIDDVLLALAPPLRLGLLSLSAEAMLRVLALGEWLARRVLSLSSDGPTPQAVHKILTAAGPTLRLLARDGEAVEVPEGDSKVAPLGSPKLTFAAYLALRDARGPGGMLAALEKAIEPSFSTADRSVLLGFVASRIEHAQAGSAPRRGRTRSPVEGIR